MTTDATIATDEQLLDEYRSGDEAAFAELVCRHIDWVYSAARRRVGNTQLAEDVTQAVFLALAKVDRSKPATVAPWLYGAVRRVAANAIRADARRRRHEAAAARPEALMPGDEPDWQTLSPLLEPAVDRLTKPDRLAVILRFYRRQTFAQIGLALAVSEDGARKRVERAIQKLRGELSRHGTGVASASLAGVLQARCVEAAAPQVKTAAIARTVTPSVARLARSLKAGTLIGPIVASCIVVAVVATIIFLRSPAPTLPVSAIASTAPTSQAAAAASQPAMSLNDLLAAIKRTETQFQNVYLSDFDTVVERLPAGATAWQPTRLHYAGSAWFDADPRGKHRVYYANHVLASEDGRDWSDDIWDISWNGKEAHWLTLAGGMAGESIRMRHAVIASSTEPMFDDIWARLNCGINCTLQYQLTSEDLADKQKPRRSVSSDLTQAAKEPSVKWTITRDHADGFDCLCLRFDYGEVFRTWWFAPDKGFALVKFAEMYDLPNEKRTEGFDVDELKNVGDGLWFPIRSRVIRRDAPTGSMRFTTHIGSVTVNDPSMNQTIFTAPIPTGWMVTDQRVQPQRIYVTLTGGSQQDVKIGTALPNVPAGVSHRPDGEDPPITHDRRVAW